jgi:hypothetical protein
MSDRWSIVRSAAAALLVLCTVVAAAAVLVVWPRLFDGTPDGVGRLSAARCDPDGNLPCEVRVLELSPGRYWLEATPTDTIRLDFAPRGGNVGARVLLLGARSAGLDVAVFGAGPGGTWQRIDVGETSRGIRRRRLFHLAPGSTLPLRVLVRRSPGPGEPDGALRVEEIGLFASEEALLADARRFLTAETDRRVYNGILARALLLLAGLGLVASALVPGGRGRVLAATFGFATTLAVVTLELWLVFNPYWLDARDLRVHLASGPLRHCVGCNLNYGMYLGSRLLEGEGLTYPPSRVPWDRTPGYGFVGALAGLVAGYDTSIFTIGLYLIRLHLLFFAAANAIFVAAASLLMRREIALAVALAVAFMPNQISNTQADSVMVPIYLLTAAALCLYLQRRRAGSRVPTANHLLVHLPFALWFLVRPDGFVGWAAVSVLLYWRRWRLLVLPAALFLLIGVSWGLYKYQYTGEFSMTTNTVGDNAWKGLWMVPNKFRWETTDQSYHQWAEEKGVPPTSKLGSEAALRETAHFLLTYPVYGLHVAVNRFVGYVDVNVFNSVHGFPRVYYEKLRGAGVGALLCVVALCLVLGHERSRTLLLGWPLFFSLPLFLLFFSDGMRHVAPVSAALFVAGLPPLLERGLYLQTRRRWRAAATTVGVFIAAWLLLHWADGALLASDTWRYWTPFLDPAPFNWYLPGGAR